MVSGIPTASGYEERIRFAEMEVVERGANESGLLVNRPEGHAINGWDINVAGVRTTLIKRTVRYHTHAEFIVRVRRGKGDDKYVGKRYGDFSKLHKRLRVELPGKVLPPLPRKNKSQSLMSFGEGGDDDDASSDDSSISTANSESGSALRVLGQHKGHRRSTSAFGSRSARSSPRPSVDHRPEQPIVLYRETQRVSLRAFLRTILQNEQIADSKAVEDFFTGQSLSLNEEELRDIARRKEMDEKRIDEQKKFYDVARQRARELDVYMERFRRDVIESNGLSKLFAEIKEKDKLEDLTVEYKKFAEWLRIEYEFSMLYLRSRLI